MEDLFSWVKDNQVLSGVGATALTAVGWLIKRFSSRPAQSNIAGQPSISIVNTNSVGNVESSPVMPAHFDSRNQHQVAKDSVRILFIDDDTKFKVVSILRNAGWTNVKITKDIKDFEAPEVKDAHVFFVDIQGVGKAMGFQDEGLGLSLALKQKYPDKKVVIYSAQTDGYRFHRALNKADGSLSKNAEPYQFIALVEELMGF